MTNEELACRIQDRQDESGELLLTLVGAGKALGDRHRSQVTPGAGEVSGSPGNPLNYERQ